jgi:hypothetical protein
LRTILHGHAGIRVGVCWAGAAGNAYHARRSIPLPSIRSLWNMEGVTWFSLQKESTAGPPLVELPARDTLDDTAAFIAELDLVVTVDTSIAHLAGALAAPTWVLLPHAADWRWQLAHDRTPWYPTMRLFRQHAPGDWLGVLHDVRAALRERTAEVRA